MCPAHGIVSVRGRHDAAHRIIPAAPVVCHYEDCPHSWGDELVRCGISNARIKIGCKYASIGLYDERGCRKRFMLQDPEAYVELEK